MGRGSKSPSEYPAYSTEETSSWPILGSEHSDSSPASQWIALIKNIGDVEPELEQTVLLRQVKYVGEAHIQWIVPRQFIRVRKTTSQAAAIKEVSVDRGIFVGVRSAGSNGVTLIMVQEDPMVLDECEFLRRKKELCRSNLRSRSAFEAKICVGVKSTLRVVRGDLDSVLVSLGVVKVRKD